jgi:hypothetical protein
VADRAKGEVVKHYAGVHGAVKQEGFIYLFRHCDPNGALTKRNVCSVLCCWHTCNLLMSVYCFIVDQSKKNRIISTSICFEEHEGLVYSHAISEPPEVLSNIGM